MPSTLPTRTLASITVPDTPTITRAIAFARANNDTHTFNHVMRSWLVGQASLTHLPSSSSAVDQEAFAVAAILHDLGWSTNATLVTSTQRFEVDGANSAREFLSHEPDAWPSSRVQLVWDAIALHATPDIAVHARPLVGFVSAGVMAELFGPDAALRALGPSRVGVTLGQWEEISRVFPREGLKVHLRETLTGLCRRKPEGTYGNWVGDYGDEYLAAEGYSQVGKRTIDLIEAETKE